VPIETRIALVVAVILAVLALGLFWKLRTGRSKRIANGQQIDLAKLGAVKNGKPVLAFGERMTFLQFSTEFCSQCVQTARVYKDLEQHSDGILHIEVDITNRLDVAKEFNILQTPTTLVLDAAGRVTSRIGGATKAQTIKDEIGHFAI
jgi:thiol-disulfide isomerase/thioredoxin